MDKLVLLIIVAAVAVAVWRRVRRSGERRREALIERYRFPQSIGQKVARQYPHLNDAEVQRVLEGLREYFQLCNRAGRRMVSMPSQAVDVAWHEFILFTRQYREFCRRGLGRFLHHTPAEAMRSPTLAQKGIRTAWRLACLRERIDPFTPDRLPLLFALDSELEIPDGFRYSLDCKSRGGYGYCAGHIGCGSGCTGSDGAHGCGADSGSSGCGGGCGGGGD